VTENVEHASAPDPGHRNIVVGTPHERLTQVLDRVAAHEAGVIYITVDDLPNPYDKLPSFWSEVVSSLGG